ncbi:MAG: hypothetical protein LUD71_05440 [Clostridiales bacterium]|nr:hypothetical protein [Clostridiales bacterium]
MFKKSERKIVFTIMMSMISLLVCTLFIIYFSNFWELYQNSQENLAKYISTFSLDEIPDIEDMPEPEELSEENDPPANEELPSDQNAPADMDLPNKQNLPSDAEAPDNQEPFNENDSPKDQADSDSLWKEQIYQLSVFYSVTFSDEIATSVDISNNVLYSRDDLIEYATSILSKGRTKGLWKSLIYRVETTDDYTVVVMMDNTIVSESLNSLFRYTLLFGGIACALIFFLSLFLSGKIVKPLRESYNRQKQFISDAGHELKTPVSAISANLEVLFRDIGDN